MFALALPITVQSFITSSLNLIDNVMVGRLGEAPIASVGLANQYIFIFTLCIMGINAGASIFMAQFWGKKDVKNIKTFLGVNITIGLIASILFGLGAAFFSEEIMMILSQDSEVITLGSSYLKIVSISCLVMSFTQAYSSALRSTEQVKLPMYASLIGVLTNAFLNWVFIFGNLGAPIMGVSGAALATTIARFIEMIFIISVIYITNNKVAAKLKDMFTFNFNTIKVYFKTSWSVIANELVWSIGLTAYSIAYARIGTNAVATMQIATTLNNLFLVLLVGLASAATIIIGNKIGANEEEVAREYSHNIAKMSIVIGFLLGIVIWLMAPLVLKPFNVTTETYTSTIKVLKIMAVFFTLRSYNMVMIIGVFRGGGDTTFAMLLQGCTIWFYSVPISFIGAILLKLPIEGVFFLICTEEIIKAIFQTRRLKTGKWLKNVISDIEIPNNLELEM
ncbi:MATE family efflux transporter [Clostridium tarantellae]|uniref:MATE family efflux transporter n=2 Tax=Clostridium tarantellae TaxID=39493 RepID=A0A6I1MMN5_9CLOT|nr:MATE family efflux transporter [Clostridium tarantellae]MPQ42191.1 MATE family efflux transporter [Clostridium tarantellae]